MTYAHPPDQGNTSPEGPGRAPLPTSEKPAPVELRSLAPSYAEEHHGTYLDHLEVVVRCAKNKNVALTGRYGTGKSSVLDEFEKKHKDKVLRIGITTLSPDRDGERLTNRIQKELVKQLIYRNKPSDLRSSRFARTDPITPKMAWKQGAAITAVLGLFVGLGGWLPTVTTFPTNLTISGGSAVDLLFFVFLWGLFFAAATAIAAWVRMAFASRIVTSLSTAGTSITLGERDDTYFDAYLDELVTHFDKGGENYVIFEDLDRFDDPAIFDSLRELNTILNSSPKRKNAAHESQLCFIYAIKDSLFERLAQPVSTRDPETEQNSHEEGVGRGAAGDKDSSTTTRVPGKRMQDQRDSIDERANRTKFFDVVIPMVPFLSHRNARDVLDNELAQRKIPGDTVSRALLALVARHTTDMRLMLNILNEFTVYAQRLLWVPHPAPELTGDRLFALVAYKNFHLADFEAVPARKSSLDELDRAHRELVRHAVSTRQKQRRNARDSVFSEVRQNALADRLAHELAIVARAVLLQNPQNFREPARYRVDGEPFTLASTHTIDFWTAVVQHQRITIDPLNGERPHTNRAIELDETQLLDFFPDAFAEGIWSSEEDIAVRRKIETLIEDLDFLPGADYVDLLVRHDLQDKQGRTFTNLLEAHLTSDIARELVRKGYINRNFATYSAAFYGTFTGIDAETFYYRSVQPNEMLLDHRFTREGSLRNLLEQLDNDEPEFYRTVSVLNPQIVTYLLNNRPYRAAEVAEFIATHFDDSSREFMTAFFAEDNAPHSALIGMLAAHPWRDLFDYLASDATPDTLRLSMVDAALMNASNVADFALGDDICGYVADHYSEMNAFTKEDQSQQQAEFVKEFTSKWDLRVENLDGIAPPLRRLLANSQMYALTADNLRTALGVQGSVSLDAVAKAEAVKRRALTDIDAYLQVAVEDPATPHTVETSETLRAMLSEDQEWTASQLKTILDHSSPDSSLKELSLAPPSTWSSLARHHRFAPTVSNLNTYIGQFGIDAELAGYLTANGIEAADNLGSDTEPTDDSAASQKAQLALVLLNSQEQLSAVDRATLAAQLGVGPADLPVTEIEPTADDLFAEALDRGLLEASEAAFDWFTAAGWPAVSKAVTRHRALRQFVVAPNMDDSLTQGMLEDDEVPVELHERVFADFDNFIPPASTEPELFRAAARRAVERGEKLSIENIIRIADYAPDQDTVVPLLTAHQGLDGSLLVSILVKLGAPYNLLQAAGKEAALPAGGAAATLFNRLATTGRIKLVKKKSRFQVL